MCYYNHYNKYTLLCDYNNETNNNNKPKHNNNEIIININNQILFKTLHCLNIQIFVL